MPDLSHATVFLIRARGFSSLLSLFWILSRSSLFILVSPFLSFILTTVKRELLARFKVDRALYDYRVLSKHAGRLHLNLPHAIVIAAGRSLRRTFCGNYDKRGFVRRWRVTREKKKEIETVRETNHIRI